MYPVIRIYIFTIPVYGAIFCLGFLIALFLARKVSYINNIPKEDATYSATFSAIGLVIGAKLLYFITKLPKILPRFGLYISLLKSRTLEVLNFSFGGFVFYGGLIGAVAGCYIYCKKYKISFINMIDVYTPFIPFIHGFGRISCFMAGCCYGIEYHGFGSIQFPENPLIPELNDVPRVPVQLMEAGLNFIMSFILYRLYRKKKFKKGSLFAIYIIYYSIARFLLEFLRGDIIRGNVGIFSTSQIISLILLPIGILLLIWSFRNDKSKK